MKKILGRKGLLYLILDKDLCEKKSVNIFNLAEKSAKTGVDFLQLRFAKDENDRKIVEFASKIKKITKKYGSIFIVNNRVDIALAADADGVHLGETDILETTARKIMGRKFIIGRTIHTIPEAKKARQEIIDYISVGPVFATETKPYLNPLGINKTKKILVLSKKPAFVIGGINLSNIKKLKEAKISCVALSRGISLEKNIIKTVEKIKAILN